MGIINEMLPIMSPVCFVYKSFTRDAIEEPRMKTDLPPLTPTAPSIVAIHDASSP